MNNSDRPGEKQRERERETEREARSVCACVCQRCLCVSVVRSGATCHISSDTIAPVPTGYKHPEPPTEAVCAAYVPVACKMCLNTALFVTLTGPHAPLA